MYSDQQSERDYDCQTYDADHGQIHPLLLLFLHTFLFLVIAFFGTVCHVEGDRIPAEFAVVMLGQVQNHTIIICCTPFICSLPSALVKVGEHDTDRFDRMRRIGWLDMKEISRSRILVVGAGALGNEAVKCLVLAGFGDITVIDMDTVVVSNLSRCIFFRDTDAGGPAKSEILAERASDIDQGVRITPIVGKVQDLQNWDYDLILGCLDNVSARLHVNSMACYRKIPYIDGATDGFRGKVHVVLPGGPCLECAANRSHMKLLDTRFSCTGGGGTIYVPRLPAEITTTSIIAAMQVREALKVLSNKTDLCIRNVLYYDGEACTSQCLSLDVDLTCPNHEAMMQ